MIVAEWKGGPFDGKSEALPDSVSYLAIAQPVPLGLSQTPYDISYVEVRCPVIIDHYRDRYYIIWHEPE